jgi:hypothetical protein
VVVDALLRHQGDPGLGSVLGDFRAEHQGAAECRPPLFATANVGRQGQLAPRCRRQCTGGNLRDLRAHQPENRRSRYAPTNAPGAYNNDPTSAAYADLADLSQPFKSLTGGKGAGFINTEQAANRSKDIIANLEKAGIATGQVALAASDIQTLYSQHKIKSSTDLSAPGGAWVLSETPS